MTLMVAWRHGGATNEGTNTHAEDDEICSDNSNDVYCRIKFKQMINFCHVFAFSSVILAHIVERQSDFNKDLFSVPIEKSTNECVRVWDWKWKWERERASKREWMGSLWKMKTQRYFVANTNANVNTCANPNSNISNVEWFFSLCCCCCCCIWSSVRVHGRAVVCSSAYVCERVCVTVAQNQHNNNNNRYKFMII